MSDYGALQTDAEYLKLEKQLKSLYTDCAKDIQKKMNVFFAKFEKKDAAWHDQLKQAEGAEEYKALKQDFITSLLCNCSINREHSFSDSDFNLS